MTCHHARQPPPPGSPEEFRIQLRSTVRLLGRALTTSEPGGWRLAPDIEALVLEYIEVLDELVSDGALVGPRLTVAAGGRHEPDESSPE